MADYVSPHDFVILDKLGDLPFAQFGGHTNSAVGHALILNLGSNSLNYINVNSVRLHPSLYGLP